MRVYTKDESEEARRRNPAWWEVECAPVGIIESFNDIRFAVDYGKQHDIDVKNIEKYLHDSYVIGRKLSLGSHFGGASFYYYVPA